jgi:hypothetical protein
MGAKVCMFLNYGHHPIAADDFSSLSVVLGSLSGDTYNSIGDCISTFWREPPPLLP